MRIAMSSFQRRDHHEESGDTALSLDELNNIMDLQRQEAFDETLEDVHSSISKRDAIRKSLRMNSSQQNTATCSNSSYYTRPPTSPQSSKQETAEMKLLKLIHSKKVQSSPSVDSNNVNSLQLSSDNRISRPSIEDRHRRNSAPMQTVVDNSQRTMQTVENISSTDRRRRRSKSRTREPGRTRSRNRSRSRSRTTTRTRSNDEASSCNEGDSGLQLNGHHRRSSLPHGPRGLQRNSRNVSMSALEDAISVELEELRLQSDKLSQSQYTNRRRWSGKSHRSDDASVRSARSSASSASRNSSRSRRRTSINGTDVSYSLASISRLEESTPENLQGEIQEKSKEVKKEMIGELLTPHLSSDVGTNLPVGSRKTCVADDSDVMSRHKKPKKLLVDVASSKTDQFEEIWQNESTGHQSSKSLDLESSQMSPLTRRSFRRSSSKKDLESVDSSIPGIEKVKKTKLEKIHELQAKCDRYKKEWADASNEKRRYRKDLETSQHELKAKKQEVQTYITETQILQKNLSDALTQLEEIQEEQRNERKELSNTAKQLAEARIGHAKSVNEVRELREKLDDFQQQLEDKDRQIESLQTELRAAKQNIEHLEADILYADDQIEKLEGEIKNIEDEIVLYREAANKNNDENGESSSAARNEVERRLQDEREKRLVEKERKLDEKSRQFEEDRERHLQMQCEREQVFTERQALEVEKSKSRDEARHRRDDEINDRLKTLEDDNRALQGKLKSEQLDTNVKLSAKDKAIEKLQKELENMKNEMARQRTDPNSVLSFQAEVESSRAAAETARRDLEEALRHNAMLQESTDDAQLVNKEMQLWITKLEETAKEQQKEAEFHKRKADEWQKKSGEWSDKAHQWREKADHWEKIAKLVDPDAKIDSSNVESALVDPQALFLAAAVEKKKSSAGAAAPSNGGWGRLFSKGADSLQQQSSIEELEIKNTKQAAEIKTLKSELVQIRSQHREKAFQKQRELERLQKSNINLLKELENYKRLIKASSNNEKDESG